jgi:hypothetical protein
MKSSASVEAGIELPLPELGTNITLAAASD